MATSNNHNGKRMTTAVNTTCPLCNDSFSNTSNINKHLRVVHKVEPTENTRAPKRKREDTAAIGSDPSDCNGHVSPSAYALPADPAPPMVLTSAADPDTINAVDAGTLSDVEEGYFGDDCDNASESEDDGDADGSEDDEVEIRNNIDSIMAARQSEVDLGEDGVWNRSIAPGNPFDNAQTLIMMCLYNGYSNPLSRAQLKTLLYGINKIVDLAIESTKENKTFKMPTANKILKGDEGQKYDGPKVNLTTTQHQVLIKKEEVTASCTAILPSEHLKLSMANPREAQYLSALPDRSIGVSKGLTTGSKWVTHPDFQHPQITVDGKDFWIGDLVEVQGFSGCFFLLKTFFVKDGCSLADGYIVMQLGDIFGVVDEVTEVSQSSLLNVKDKASLSASKCCTLGSTDRSLKPDHHQLLFGHNESKVQKDGNPTQFYKVVICPEIFFSDDTSGGNSKQFLPYESWSMVHAALPFEDRGRRENTKYLGCVPKSEGLSRVLLLI